MFDLNTWMFVLVRAGALLSVLPVFSAPVFPVRLRIALGVALAFFIAPGVASPPLAGLPWFMVMLALGQEVLVGVLLGFVARMIFFAVEIAGTLISTELGLSLTPSFNPLQGGRTETPALLLYYLAAMLFLSLDLHHWMLAAFQRSYEVLPIGQAGLPNAILAELIHRSAQVIGTAVQMAAPMIATSFFVSLLFAILGRAVPQMNVFGESFAVRLLAGLAIFGLTLNLMAQYILNYLRRLPDDFLLVAGLLART